MSFLWYLLIFFLKFAFIKLQTADVNHTSSINETAFLIDFDHPQITILGALTNYEHVKILNDNTNQMYRTAFNQEIYLSSQSFILDSNPLLIAMKLCEIGNVSNAKAIIAGRGLDENDLTLTAISYVSDFYHIPVLTIASRENLFSDKAFYNFIVRLVPPYLYEADAWFSIIRKLKYTKVVLIYSQDEEGRMVGSRFQMLTEDSEIHIERMEEYESNANFTSLISNLTYEDRLLARVFIIHTRIEDTDELLSVIVRLQHLENFVWIINERAIISNSTALFDGLIGVRLHNSFNEENLLIDATKLLANAFNKFTDYSSAFWTSKTAAINCLSTDAWTYGIDFYRELLNTSVVNGITGNIEFNEEGDRIESLYDIVNVQDGQLKTVGHYRTNTIDKTELKVDEDQIIWPNRRHRKPDGIRTRRNVSVVTIAEKPFIFTRSGNDCDPATEVVCPRKRLNDSTNEEYEYFCCRGYCIDLLQELSKNLSFVYTLHLVADNKYGSYEKEGDDKHKRWDGMIGELVNYQADMIIAPLTISPERAEDIEFTKPFKYQGITILVRKSTSTSNLASFLQPFKEALWMMVLLSVHVVAVVLYLLDRFSPFGRFRFSSQQKSERGNGPVIEVNTEEDALNLSRALWFTWGILLNSGIGEGTPRSFSARVLGMVWAGFAMIMVASYTANLAAFLVLDRPEASISGINDARLRNPQDGFTYATVKGSSVDMYFKRQVELSTMYRTMESKNYLTAEDAITDLRDGKLKAFIWDSPRLEYEAAQDCDLVTAGELFGRSSYGIALRKKDAWINPLSHTILSFHEKGFMETLDNAWIFSKGMKQCSDRSSSPATLGVNNMLGVFLLVAGGIFAGFFLLAIEIAFKRRKERRENEMEVSRNALLHWRKKIEKRKQRSIIYESDNQQQPSVDTDLLNEAPSNRMDRHKLSNMTNNRAKSHQSHTRLLHSIEHPPRRRYHTLDNATLDQFNFICVPLHPEEERINLSSSYSNLNKTSTNDISISKPTRLSSPTRRVHFKFNEKDKNRSMNNQHVRSSDDVRFPKSCSIHRVEFRIPIHKDINPWLNIDCSSTPTKARTITSNRIDINYISNNNTNNKIYPHDRVLLINSPTLPTIDSEKEQTHWYKEMYCKIHKIPENPKDVVLVKLPPTLSRYREYHQQSDKQSNPYKPTYTFPEELNRNFERMENYMRAAASQNIDDDYKNISSSSARKTTTSITDHKTITKRNIPQVIRFDDQLSSPTITVSSNGRVKSNNDASASSTMASSRTNTNYNRTPSSTADDEQKSIYKRILRGGEIPSAGLQKLSTSNRVLSSSINHPLIPNKYSKLSTKLFAYYSLHWEQKQTNRSNNNMTDSDMRFEINSCLYFQNTNNNEDNDDESEQIREDGCGCIITYRTHIHPTHNLQIYDFDYTKNFIIASNDVYSNSKRDYFYVYL
ncbi:unnamed protein product [Rotaria magnacalcarata]|uniref:Glutamate [NMDA] receptor subunit 1 n=1 Tax=Rotaria magnacalcarata TaxID=392030 RepID=A0A818XRU2_9BILA|nr:unnamed protein product [Rotaria magnacalcarata]